MARKYLKLRKVLIPTMAILMMTSQMAGCSSVEQSEMEAMQESNEFIEVTVPELITEEEIANMESTEATEQIQEADQSVVEVTASNGQLNNTEIPVEHEEGSYYFEIKEDGSREYSLSLVTEVMQLESFEGLSYEEVITVLNNHLPDNICGDPYEDEAIRDYISFLDKSEVYRMVGKELPVNAENNQSNQSEVNNTTSDSSLVAESNQSTSNQTSTNQSENQTANSVQNTTPSTNQTVENSEELSALVENPPIGDNGLILGYYTPEEWALVQPGTSLPSGTTGEACEDFLNHN